MRILRNHLKIMFGEVQPEAVIASINGYDRKNPFKICSNNIEIFAYRHFSRSLLRNLTCEEVDMRYYDMKKTMDYCGKFGGGSSVFVLLPEYTYGVLKEDGERTVCRQEQFLNWRECYLALGQDLLVSAHLAYKSCIDNRKITDFGWPAMIGTDDRRLMQIMERGLAENHFHLKGSTRSFDLSWMCLMNHPKQIKEFFKKEVKKFDEDNINVFFIENLNETVNGGWIDNRLSWHDRVLLACWIRRELFIWLCSNKNSTGLDHPPQLTERFSKFYRGLSLDSANRLEDKVTSIRFSTGTKFKQLDGKYKILDYAITSEVFTGLPDRCSTRSLAGERAFLYDALYMIYSHDTKEIKEFADLFYLYILIKSQFRKELIQANNRYGFKNFMMYQNRKDLIFDTYLEYDLEAKNLSVYDSMENGYVTSLEMRIVPAKTPFAQYKKIYNTDRSINFLRGRKLPQNRSERKKYGSESPYFYVLHFPKKPDNFKKLPKYLKHIKEPSYFYISMYGEPRNYQVRKDSERQAKAVAGAMANNDWLCTRIRGIDACTYEIGCRPEVFAAEFRFLTSYVSHCIQRNIPFDDPVLPKICATYHVGEDFMDIVDGLRAIDETIIFLELESGDRLGHALALGIDPLNYYKLKGNNILLPKQDLLDNIVWLLNKSKSFNIDLESSLKQQLYDDAKRLIYEIYGSGFDMRDYCGSYQLRGDDPELYRKGSFDKTRYNEDSKLKKNILTAQYNFCRIRKRYDLKELEIYRENSKAVELFWRYHFDHRVKQNGSEVERQYVSIALIKTIEKLQVEMQKEISQRKIAIECNLSSNVLIGPFERYERHPIFRFYPISLREDEPVQYVSVNTDDQGVFDTSLQTEYTILACVLHSIKNENGIPKYNDDMIYSYIERIRQNGFSQSFPGSQNAGQTIKQPRSGSTGSQIGLGFEISIGGYYDEQRN